MLQAVYMRPYNIRNLHEKEVRNGLIECVIGGGAMHL